MANTKSIIAATLAADGGAFYRAPTGTALPTTATGTLNAAFKDHGWIGDDGIKLSPKRDIKKHKAFGGQVVKTTSDTFDVSLKVTLYETNLVNLQTVVGTSNVVGTYTSGHMAYRVNWVDGLPPHYAFVTRFVDGNKTGLHVIEDGQVVNVEDIVWLQNELVKYTLEIDCFKPSSGNPAVYTLIDDPDNTTNES